MERLRILWEAAAIGIFLTDAEGRFVDANPEYLRITGYDLKTLQGMTIWDLDHPDDLAPDQALYRKIVQGEQERSTIEQRIRHAEGRTIWVRVVASRVPHGDGFHVIGLMEDRTETHALEEQRRRDQEALAHSNRELEQFAYIASHDLQAPLRHVATFAGFLSERSAKKLDDEERRWLGRMREGVDRMQALIRSLLAFSKVQRTEIQKRSVDPARLLDQVLEDLGAEIQEAGGTVEVGSLPTLDADPTLLARVFQNLLENSLRYRADRPLQIHIEGHVDGGDAVITVQDNGSGFHPSQKERVFQLFQRLDHDGGGAGIGLALCRNIIHRHGGSIEASGSPGNGATFTLRIPLSQ